MLRSAHLFFVSIFPACLFDRSTTSRIRSAVAEVVRKQAEAGAKAHGFPNRSEAKAKTFKPKT